MKKLTILICASLLLGGLFTACSAKSEFPELDSQTVSYQIVSAYSYSDSGEWEISSLQRNEYDTNGNKIVSNHVDDTGSTQIDLYEYDENGLLIQHIRYINDILKFRYTFEYNDHGDETTALFFDEIGNFDEELSRYHSYEYDENGNIIKKTAYADSNRSIEEYIYTYTYDEYNNITGQTKYSVAEKKYSTTVTIYEYDANGNILSQMSGETYNDPGTWSVYEYEYDDAGNMIKWSIYYQEGYDNNDEREHGQYVTYEYYTVEE